MMVENISTKLYTRTHLIHLGTVLHHRGNGSNRIEWVVELGCPPIIHGSVLGPIPFNTNLFTKTCMQMMLFLIAPSSNSSSLPSQLMHLSSWVRFNKLNPLPNPFKTQKLIKFEEIRRGSFPALPTLPNVEWVISLKLQGANIQGNFSMDDHESAVVSKSAQSLFVLKTL